MSVVVGGGEGRVTGGGHSYKVISVTTLELFMFLHSKKDLISGGFKDPPNQLWVDRAGESHHETKFLFTSGRLLSVARNNLHISRRVDILPS